MQADSGAGNSGRRLARLARALAPALLVLATVLALYRTVWWPEPGKRAEWLGWDCLEAYWPDLAYTAGRVGAGEAPLWNPYQRGGYAFASDPQPALYSPVTWAFAGAGALAGGVPPWVMQWKQLLMLAGIGVSMTVLLRRIGLPTAAAAVAGVLAATSVPSIIHKASGVMWPLVFLPLVWLALLHLARAAGTPGGWRRAAALAATMWLAGSAGSPPVLFYVIVAAIPVGLYAVTSRLRAAAPGSERRRLALVLAGDLGLAAVASLLLLAVVVVPGLAMAAASATRGASRTVGYALNTALPAGPTLLGLVTPVAGKVDAYVGLLGLALALVALVAPRPGERARVLVFAGIALLAYVLAFGGATPVLPWLVRHVPGFGLFREPNRYKLIAALALAVLAGHGLAAAITPGPSRRRALVTLAATALVLAVVAVVARDPGAPVGVNHVLLVLGTGGAAIAALVLAPGRGRLGTALVAIGAVALAAVTTMDTARAASRALAAREAPVDDREDRRALADLPGAGSEWRVYDEFVMEQRPGSRLAIRDFRDYPGGDPLDDARYALVRAALARSPELVAAFNVRWVLQGPHHRNGTQTSFLAQHPDTLHPERFHRLDAHRLEVVDPAPLAAWYGGLTMVADTAAAISALTAESHAPGARQHAVIERGDVPAVQAPSLAALTASVAPVAGTLADYGANRMTVAIDAPAAGVVVVNEAIAPGWSVTVDRAAAIPLRVDVMLRGVLVDAGHHVITWSYWPPHYTGLLALWWLGLAFLAVAAITTARSARPGGPRGSGSRAAPSPP